MTFESKHPLFKGLDPKRGGYVLVRVDGTVQTGKFGGGKGHPSRLLAEVYQLIGCTGIDTVILDRDREIVMLVDDVGLLDGKPLNPVATALYRSIRQSPHYIAGDAVIVCDKDFE